MSEMTQYTIRDAQGHEYGPADLHTLRQWISEKRILGHFQIAPVGTQNWQTVSSHPQLADLFAAPTPTPAASPYAATSPATPTYTGQPASATYAPQPTVVHTYEAPRTSGTSGLAIGSMICGIAGTVCALPAMCCCVIDCLAGPAAIAGIVLGFMALPKFKADPNLKGRPMAIVGLVLGFIALALMVIGLVISFAINGMSALSSPSSSSSF